MGRPVSLFSGYNQRENRTTNYCLLLLKMLYEENPKFFGQVLGTLVSEDFGTRIGVRFQQQEGKATSTPDGHISQQALSIYIETKESDWFDNEQLTKHLEALHSEASGLKVLLALCSEFQSEPDQRFQAIQALCHGQYKNSILFKAITFEDLIQALQLDHLPKNLADAISEFREYLDEQNLLHSWERWLDVVNCASLPDDLLIHGVYMCPATGGPYTHGRCRYLGMYRNKRVERIAEIEAVVDVESDDKATIKWRNVPGAPSQFIARAQEKARLRAEERPLRVFVLGTLYETDFQKDSPGGMQSSKQYFPIASFNAKSAAELANALRGKAWSEILLTPRTLGEGIPGS